MKFKKFLAGVVAAALAVTMASLPQVVSASDEDEAEDSILHWTLTAKSSEPITVVPGVSETEPDQDDGPYVSPYEPHIIKFDLGDIEAKIEPYSSVNYLITYTRSFNDGTTWSNSIDATADINVDDDGNYNFICAVPTSILNDENNTLDKVTAYLTLGNAVAELEVDLTSDEVQSFTTENSQPVKIVGNNPDANGSFSLYLGYLHLGYWDIAELDTLYLPITDIDYRYSLGLHSQEDGIRYSTQDEFFAVEEGGVTLNLSYIIPDVGFITLKLDKSELPADKYLNHYYVYNYSYVHGDDGKRIGTIHQDTNVIAAESGEITLDEITLFKGYSYADVNLYYPYGYNTYNYQYVEGLSYYLADSLEDGATVQLGTDFTADSLRGYYSDEEYHPGDSLTLWYGNLTDKYGNEIALDFTNDTVIIPVTITFTNVDDPDDIYTITIEKIPVPYLSTYHEVTLPEGMNGKYDIEIYAERTVDLSEQPEVTETTTTTTAPSVPPSTSAEAKPAETTTQPSADVELSDSKTGVTITADEGVLDEGVELKVDIGSTTVEGYDHIYVLDITLVDENGEKVQPNGYVTVKIPVPYNFLGWDNYYVYYQAEDGTLVDMRATYEDGYVIFTTNHFSTYILSTEKLVDDSGAATTVPADVTAAPASTTTAAASTGNDEDKNMSTGVFLAFIPAIAAAAGVIISKKRK